MMLDMFLKMHIAGEGGAAVEVICKAVGCVSSPVDSLCFHDELQLAMTGQVTSLFNDIHGLEFRAVRPYSLR